eukprot:513323-Prorocentrum_minimum.AAC.1
MIFWWPMSSCPRRLLYCGGGAARPRAPLRAARQECVLQGDAERGVPRERQSRDPHSRHLLRSLPDPPQVPVHGLHGGGGRGVALRCGQAVRPIPGGAPVQPLHAAADRGHHAPRNAVMRLIEAHACEGGVWANLQHETLAYVTRNLKAIWLNAPSTLAELLELIKHHELYTHVYLIDFADCPVEESASSSIIMHAE